jgi:iron complex outermembrane receptor protein
MNTQTSLTSRWLHTALCALGFLAAALSLPAQTTAGGTGSIQGRVFNPVSKEYVGNAEVRLEGTNRVDYTESDGSFRFDNVPTGTATVTVGYTGYTTARETFNISAGQVATREISLTSTAANTNTKSKDGVVQLEAFTVSSEREGNSKAIMAQRRNMNITTSVSSDIFGDVTDGNVGEFLKYLPGVDLDYVESEPRGPRLGGMDGQYVGVAFDGMRTASADANRGGGSASRATSFEGFSITAIDSIEINRTASPENDADSPAGTVNMKTKRAFDRKGRRVNYNLSANFNDEEFTLDKTPGPRDHPDYKWKPNWQLDYSESFFNQRFGLLLSASHSYSYTEQIVSTAGYSDDPTATDTRPLVVRQVDFKDGPKFIQKDSLLLTADWKVTPRLVVSLNAIYSYFDGEFWNRNFTFVAANDNTNVNNGRTHVGGNGVTEVIATRAASGSVNNVATLNNGGGGAAKLVYTRQFAPRFEYKLGSWVVDGALAYSRSKNNYESNERGFSKDEGGGVASSWVATRPSDQSWEWTIRQTSGNDWFDLHSFSNTNTNTGGTRVTNDDRTWVTEKWTGMLNARWAVPMMERFPTVVKFGGKWDEESRINRDHGAVSVWSYIGPGGNTVAINPTTGTYVNTSFGNWANLGPQYISSNPFELGTTNALTVYNINGQPGMPPRPSRNAMNDLFRAHPEQFVNTTTPENYYTSYIANDRNFRQTITAGYAQADTRLTSKLQVRFGVRMEQTRNDLTEWDPLTRDQVIAKGFTVNSKTSNGGRALTIPGLQYQFMSQPRIKRSSQYHNWFPSLLVKYQIQPNLEWQIGVNKGISRPPIDNLTGLWVTDENALRVSAPNPDLQPEYHKVYQTRLAYYFSGRSPGQVSVALIQDEATNFITSQDYSASEFGVDDPDFSAYTFRSTRNSDSLQRYRNLDFNYNQTLGFLPSEYLRGINFSFTYSRSYANQRRQNLAPHRVTSRLGYAYRRFNGALGVIWADDKPESGTYGRYFGAITKYDLTMSFKLTSHASLYVQGRNITNVKDLWYQGPATLPEGTGAYLRQMEEYGANWVFGVKGTF